MCRIYTQAVVMSKATRQTRQGWRAQHNGDLRKQGSAKPPMVSNLPGLKLPRLHPRFLESHRSHGASIVVDERQSIPCLKISGKDLRKVVLQDLDGSGWIWICRTHPAPPCPTLPMMAMMPMMASGQGDSVALETLETLPPWLWPIGPIGAP